MSRWLDQGGPPPFPAKRVHPDTGDDLPPGTRVFNGGSVLAADPAKLPDWIRAAEMYLQGSALSEIAGDFERRGVRNYYSGRMKSGQEPRWTATHIRKILSNPALIGHLLVFLATLPSESGETAQLAPLWTRKRVGNRDWEQAAHTWTGVEVKSSPPRRWPAATGTC